MGMLKIDSFQNLNQTLIQREEIVASALPYTLKV